MLHIYIIIIYLYFSIINILSLNVIYSVLI